MMEALIFRAVENSVEEVQGTAHMGGRLGGAYMDKNKVPVGVGY
jgi:hypothetical protein